MQRVIDLARTIRERHGRTVKTPVRELVVVHSDQGFLDDLTGALPSVASWKQAGNPGFWALAWPACYLKILEPT